MNINVIFAILAVVFVALLIYGGILTRKWIADASDFILAGREINTLLNVFGVAAIGFAGTSITLSPGFSVLYGFWGSFICLGIIYSLGGLSLYGVLFTKFIIRCGAQTLPEWLEFRFDNKVRLVATIGTIIGLTGIMANNVVSMAVVVEGFIGWPVILTVSGMFLVFLTFSYLGGLWAITFTDFIQMVLGLVAIPVVIFSFFHYYGDFGWLQTNWPAAGSAWSEGAVGSLPVFSLQYPSVITFALLFAAFLVWGNNYYWIRAASARNESSARLSYIWAGILLCVVFYIPLTLVGNYAFASFPDVFAVGGGTLDATAAYGVFLRELSIFVAAFLLLAPLAAGISTSTTAHIGATSTAVRDIYRRQFRPNASPKELLKPSRVILLSLGILVWLLTFYPGGPIYLFAFSTAWLGPPALLVFLGVVWRRFNTIGALLSAVFSITTMVILTLLDLLGIFSIGQYTHVGVAGLAVALLFAIIGTMISKPSYYGEPSWEKTPTSGNREDIKLDDDDVKLLEFIFKGYENMSDLSDITGEDVANLNVNIQKLDRGGYIEREALIGSGFYTFKIADKGKDKLSKLNEEERTLAEHNLTYESLRVLRIAINDPAKLADLVKSEEFSSLKLSVVLAKLARNGYLLDQGFWRRVIKVTPAGKNISEQFKSIQTA